MSDDSVLIEVEPESPTPTPPVDAPPKRGPGRPKGSRNAVNSGTRARSTKPNIRQACVAITQAANLALVFSRRFIPQIREDDVLSDEEMTLLAKALEAEATQSARIARWAERAGGISVHAVLIEAAVLIATPRLQRRGILPAPEPMTPEQEAILRDFYKAKNGASADAPVSMGAGGAPIFDGANGFRENNVS